ncbi:unnamed protein product [Adineta steineri]|uniref:Uncharacterized protein n=1 Tax=Adineta steineri TaxID=433720 RepID=A0A815VV39_9BILA|nr:unnamed protein product [Adineta steineri]CAF1537709.1 unnamed protein product [Adineta steineri]
MSDVVNETTSGSTTTAYGLWKTYYSYSGVTTCNNINCPAVTDDNGFCSRIMVSRAFMTLACILSGITAICLFICAFIDEKKSRIFSLITIALASVCLIMGIIGVAVGGSIQQTLYLNSSQLNFGTGFIIGAVAVGINFIGTIERWTVKKSEK